MRPSTSFTSTFSKDTVLAKRHISKQGAGVRHKLNKELNYLQFVKAAWERTVLTK